MMQKICVYCGSSNGNNPAYRLAAKQLGAELASRKITLVYGGASIGIMGTIADAVLTNGGEVIGVIPHLLTQKEIAHPHLTELIVVSSMHERKTAMATLADGFIALPGGLGTLEELFEILTWAQLGIHQKPCALLNIAGYYDALICFLDQAVAEQFIKRQHRSLLLVEPDPSKIIDSLTNYPAPPLQQLLDIEKS